MDVHEKETRPGNHIIEAHGLASLRHREPTTLPKVLSTCRCTQEEVIKIIRDNSLLF